MNGYMDEPVSPNIPNFTWGEVADKTSMAVQLSPRFWRHMELLQDLRHWWGAPLTITSGYRTTTYGAQLYMRQNPDIPSADARARARRSQHLLSEQVLRFATDIVPNPSSLRIQTVEKSAIVQVFADQAQRIGFRGIGRYSAEGFIHLDLRRSPVEWRG